MIHHPTFPGTLDLAELQSRMRPCEDALGALQAIGVIGDRTVGSFDDAQNAVGVLVLHSGAIEDAIVGQAMILGQPQTVSATRDESIA